MRRLKTALCALALSVMASCTGDDKYSTVFPCYFVFRTDYHQTTFLARVLDNPGVYAKVTVQKRSGINHLVVSPNTGDGSEDIALTTAIESQYNYSNVGANQCIIIGCNTVDTGQEAWRAYDGQCPYCLETYSGVSYPLSWANNGAAVSCAKCKRTYSLNYDGISDDGYRLLQYRVRNDGTAIIVTNN